MTYRRSFLGVRFRVTGDLGSHYRFEVRVLGVWWKLTSVSRYDASRHGSVVGAALDHIYQAATEEQRPLLRGPYGFYREAPTMRVALVPKGSEAEKAIDAAIARVSAEHAAQVFQAAGLTLKDGNVYPES